MPFANIYVTVRYKERTQIKQKMVTFVQNNHDPPAKTRNGP